jgi:hypothetical protein
MRKLLITLFASIALLMPLALPAAGSAVNVFQNCGTGPQTDVCSEVQTQNSNGTNPIIHIIKVVIDILSFAIGVAAVIILIISGLRFVLNGGDAKAVEQARSGVLYALVGIVVAVVAQTIVVFVLNRIK